MIIRNVRPWGADAADIVIEGDRIAEVRPHDPAAVAGAADVDGRGRLAFPSFSDVHVHLDSSRIGLPFRPHTGAPGVWGMMLNDRNNWRNTDVPHAEIVAGTLEQMIAKGTTRVRTYAQVDVDCKLEKFESVLAAKERFRDHADVQIMTFPQAGILREAGTVDYLEESLKQGADVMGGIDPSQLDRDPVRHLDIVFALPRSTRSRSTSTSTNRARWASSAPSSCWSARARWACRGRSRCRTPTTWGRCRRR